MRFDLDDMFHITGDGNSYVLHKCGVTNVISPKSGKPEITRDQWFFPNFKMALQKYLDISITPADKTDVKEIIKKYDYVINKIKELK